MPIGENLRKWLWYNNNSNSRLYFIFKHNVKIGLIQIEKNENYYDIAIMVERRFRNNHLATKSLKKLRHIFCDATFRMSVQQCNVPMRKILENLHYVAGHPDEVGLIIYSLK